MVNVVFFAAYSSQCAIYFEMCGQHCCYYHCRYLCTLCTATTKTAKTELGTFTINRTSKDIEYWSEYRRLNPDKLSETKLDELCKGASKCPILTSDPKERLLDATHADINLASFFVKLITLLIAGITSWSVTEGEVKKKFEAAQQSFDECVKENIGCNPKLFMPGNYARMLFAKENQQVILSLIPDPDDIVALGSVLEKFRFCRSVYRANDPEKTDVAIYKETAVSMGRELMEHFSFAEWPNYLHKVIEHVQELIQDPEGPGSIGAMSGEGLEGGNKVFRHFRKNLASRGNSYQSLKDILNLHWLYSSPKLKLIAFVAHRKNTCSICNQKGHNKLTCTSRLTPD